MTIILECDDINHRTLLFSAGNCIWLQRIPVIYSTYLFKRRECLKHPPFSIIAVDRPHLIECWVTSIEVF